MGVGGRALALHPAPCRLAPPPSSKRRWPFRRRSKAPAQLFPCELCDGGSSTECRQLLAVGTKVFGCASLPLARLYDFALFASQRQVSNSQLAQSSLPVASSALARRLVEIHDFETALEVRAARNLPVVLLSREYRRILQRRLIMVGGSPQDPALLDLLAAFRWG